MAYASDQSASPGRRRIALRAVPPTPHYLTAEPVARLAPAAEEQGFLETIRKLWRHRGLIALCTVVVGGAATAVAWSMPSIYVSEARVLVGVQAPRLPNVESLVADVSPDAERVQNEGFILQSRTLAKDVIRSLGLDLRRLKYVAGGVISLAEILFGSFKGIIYASVPQNSPAVAGRPSGFSPGEIAWRKHYRARRTTQRSRRNPCASR